MIDEAQLAEITRAIVERFNPRRILLFGSYARGDAGPDSDVDLFVEMETDRRPPERIVDISSLFGLRTWGLDLLVYTPAEVARLRSRRGSFLNIIEAEGKVLHERAG